MMQLHGFNEMFELPSASGILGPPEVWLAAGSNSVAGAAIGAWQV